MRIEIPQQQRRQSLWYVRVAVQQVGAPLFFAYAVSSPDALAFWVVFWAVFFVALPINALTLHFVTTSR